MGSGNCRITFDLYCEYVGVPPAYRVYIDTMLMTERHYICKNPQYFIRETVPVSIETGLHYLRVENLNPELAIFEVRNFQVNGEPVELRSETGKFYIDTKDFR